MKRIINYIWPVLLCFGIGFAASKLQAESMVEWYPHLNKSGLTPPNIAFPIAWSIIYLLMGLSLGRVLNKGYKEGVFIWTVQLVLNFLWSILFFTMRMPVWGMVDILLLDASVVWFMMAVSKKDKPALYMFIPYILWLVIATYLNGLSERIYRDKQLILPLQYRNPGTDTDACSGIFYSSFFGADDGRQHCPL